MMQGNAAGGVPEMFRLKLTLEGDRTLPTDIIWISPAAALLGVLLGPGESLWR